MESVDPIGVARLASVRARIAQLILGRINEDPAPLGGIQLRPHQKSAVLRLRESIHEFGGAMLCDPVGTGKTFISLATPTVGARLTIVGPAVLREMWLRALSMAERQACFVSFESLSRGSLPVDRPDFVIVDEAHHARNTRTIRFRFLAQLVARADVLLLTATPIHNHRLDLVALLSLFLGERAGFLTQAELSRCLIRRDNLRSSIEGMPESDDVICARIRDDPRIPELLLSMPPPLPPRGGGDGGALIARSLIRQWASSEAALIGGLRRRIVRGESLIAALSDGTWPSKQELLSWISGEDGVQLGLAGILASDAPNTEEMLVTARQHVDSLAGILDVARESTTDLERASLIRKIRRAHPDRSIVAFSQYADTVNGLFRELSSDRQVAVLTGSGARVAGGVISRIDAISRFAPRASGKRPLPEASAVTLLLTTDLLSEGVNLQDAGVVIHLDLPWTPARIEQRLGRVARVGSRHERVQSYAILPPLGADSLIRLEAILRAKAEEAGVVVPVSDSIFGCSAGVSPRTTVHECIEEIRTRVSPWVSSAASLLSPCVATVSSQIDGFIAIADVGDVIRIVVSTGDTTGESLAQVRDALHECAGIEAETSLENLRECERSAISWLRADAALPGIHRSSPWKTPVRAVAAKRINRALRESRTHERASLARKAERALEAISGNLGAYDEVLLQRVCESASMGEQLLDQLIEFCGCARRLTTAEPKIEAMIIFVRR